LNLVKFFEDYLKIAAMMMKEERRPTNESFFWLSYERFLSFSAAFFPSRP
jgi:hypothetical protein